MNTFIAFLNKEFKEQIRSKRLMILSIIFVMFGILNPLTAKLTPFILESLASSMESSGIIIQDIKVSALDSWMQFFKNLPVLLIVYIFMQSSIFSKEYQKGTLTLVVTKGFEKYKIFLAKLIVLVSIFSVGYLVYFCITYLYSAYYWDNSIVSSLGFACFIYYVFGIFVIALVCLFNVIFENSGSSLALSGLVIFAMYLVSLIEKISKYLPILLANGNSLIYGLNEISYYTSSLIITLLLIILIISVSIVIFNKKKI